ncbi:MAG: glycosyltransferase family 2 protein, partial [Synechococcaceae bacterium WB9_2_170]|nr:glycosyltransferase family 2 protein [Synechococcaceae bacterium WB9_2_170]
AEGCLDPPTRFSWVLLPRAALQQPPLTLGSSLEQAVPWLVDQARTLGWPVLEASSAIPLLRPTDSPGLLQAAPIQTWRPDCTGVVLPYAAGQPRLSVLVASPQGDLEAVAERLRPAASLPWEVIVRPDLPDRGPGSTAAAWNSALADARGDLVWPLAAHCPALASLPLVLRVFDAPWVDLAQFAWRLGQHHHPADDPYRVEPGCLLAQRSWLQRLGGFDEAMDGRRTLQDLKQRALDRGASIHAVPLELFAH